MDIIQTLAISALLAMILYLVYINLFKDTALKTAGSITDVLPPALVAPAKALDDANSRAGPTPVPLITAPAPAETEKKVVSNQLQIQQDASTHAGSSVFNPHAVGVLPQNQDIFEKQADFGSDVTNIRQFYQNNPEVFSKILNGQNQTQVTNVADWEQQSKAMFQSIQQKSVGPIQASNFEDKYSPLNL
jgi:hypothetical protein